MTSEAFDNPDRNPNWNILREHLPYEIDLLEQCIETWTQSAPASEREPKKDWAKRMMPINGFWLHARNLIEFFRTSANDSRTAAANHFTTEPLYYEMPSEEMLQKIHAQIAHLNYDRITEFGKLTFFDAMRIKDQIDRAVAKFQNHLRADAETFWEKRTPSAVQFDHRLPPQSCTSYFSMSYISERKPLPGPTWKKIKGTIEKKQEQSE
jgi:hypothetical protein